jgi:hypothetical protein
VPSPGHDMKKAYEQLRENASLGQVRFFLSFFDPFLPVEKFFKKSIWRKRILDTPTGCASPVPRHRYRPGSVSPPSQATVRPLGQAV